MGAEPKHYTDYEVDADLSGVDYSDVEVERVLMDTDKFQDELERVGARPFARALVQAAGVTEQRSGKNGDGTVPDWVSGSDDV